MLRGKEVPVIVYEILNGVREHGRNTPQNQSRKKTTRTRT